MYACGDGKGFGESTFLEELVMILPDENEKIEKFLRATMGIMDLRRKMIKNNTQRWITYQGMLYNQGK